MGEMEERRPARFQRALGGLRRLWLAVGVTLLVLALAEGVARIGLGLRGRPADPRIRADGYPAEPWVAELYEENARSARLRWEPYVYWRRLPFAGKHIQIDRRGLRRTWRPPVAGAPPLQVYFFGSSTTWGTGVRDDHTIPSELARYLAAVGVPVEVTNFGETGYVTTQEGIALLRELHQGHVPDLAVFYLGLNDVMSTLQDGVAGLPLNESHRAREFNLPRHGRRLIRMTLEAITARSALVRLLGLGTPRPVPPATPSPALLADTFRVLDGNLRAVDGLAASEGFRTSFFWEVSLLRKLHRTPYEEGQTAVLAYSRDWIRRAYDRVERDWAARSQDEFTYLGDLFAATSGPRFIDHTHPSEAANREIAAAIGRQLLTHRRLLRRAAPGPAERR